MDYRGYMRRIEQRIGETKAADRIQEDAWYSVVMKELSAISADAAKELQSETKIVWEKPGYILQLHENPPPRLLSLAIALAAWLGWIMNEKHRDPSQKLSAQDCLRRVQEAFEYGIKLSMQGERP